MTTATVTRRGTSNSNQRGSAETRRRRKAWLIETYRADVDMWIAVLTTPYASDQDPSEMHVPVGMGEPACRCYRCGDLLTFETVTVDRIVPGCKGGKYVRNNIRPACGGCNSETGGALASRSKIRRK